jgi:hypothetical protein
MLVKACGADGCDSGKEELDADLIEADSGEFGTLEETPTQTVQNGIVL